ncbi:MAG: homoserine kinase, partial [Gammaproteobacteria bacterium]|nr:homoserine kinase [Gammaproteobacteria bacterium]
NQLLTRYHCGELIDFEGIVEGISNSNFYLTTTDGEFILTIYEHIDTPNLAKILSLQKHLNNSNFSCAKIIKTQSGSLFDSVASKPASIVEKLAGTTNYPVTNHLCQQIGQTLAQFHLLTANYEFSIQNQRGSQWISETSTKLMEHLSVQDQVILKQELEYLSRYSQLRLPAGAIHADLFPDNVLVKDDVLTGIIDFDLACHEIYLFDLCICINAWCSQPDGQLDRIRMCDMLTAYISFRPLTEDENIAIPIMLRATALRFWLSRLHDVVFPAVGELTFNKDPEEFKNILLARRQRLSGMQR